MHTMYFYTITNHFCSMASLLRLPILCNTTPTTSISITRCTLSHLTPFLLIAPTTCSPHSTPACLWNEKDTMPQHSCRSLYDPPPSAQLVSPQRYGRRRPSNVISSAAFSLCIVRQKRDYMINIFLPYDNG